MTTVGRECFQNNLDGQTVGRLVKDWTVETVGDGVIYTFNLQPNAGGIPSSHPRRARATTGASSMPMTSSTTLTSSLRMRPSMPSSPGTRRAYLCEGCELPRLDDLTVQLKRPQESFEVFWYTKQPAGSILTFESKAHVDALGEEEASKMPVYSGPWEIVDFRTGEFYRMRGVENHWRPHSSMGVPQLGGYRRGVHAYRQLPYREHRHRKVRA